MTNNTTGKVRVQFTLEEVTALSDAIWYRIRNMSVCDSSALLMIKVLVKLSRGLLRRAVPTADKSK